MKDLDFITVVFPTSTARRNFICKIIRLMYRDHLLSAMSSGGIEVKIKKLHTIMSELGHRYIDVLKIDIKGLEISVFDDMSAEDMAFKQLCIEVHDCFFKKGEAKLMRLLEKLNLSGYRLISILSRYEEFTFLKV